MRQDMNQSKRQGRFLSDVKGLFKSTLHVLLEDLIDVVVEDVNSDDSVQYIEALLYWYEFACFTLHLSEDLLNRFNFSELCESVLSALNEVFSAEVIISAIAGRLEYPASFYTSERIDAYSHAANGTLRPKGLIRFNKVRRSTPATILLLGDYMICSDQKSRPATNSDLKKLSFSDTCKTQLTRQIIFSALIPNIYTYTNTLSLLCSAYSVDMYYNPEGR